MSTETTPDRLEISGKDNFGQPRQDFADWIAAMDDETFVRKVEDCVWLSAWANNNPRSDYHWMCDVTYGEARRRGNLDLYQRGWNRAAGYSGHGETGRGSGTSI